MDKKIERHRVPWLLTFVCWKWLQIPGAPNALKKCTPFISRHVNILYDMLERNLSIPFRLLCVTDDPEGIRSDVETISLWDDYRSMGGCFTRLKVFEKGFDLFGSRFISIDLDCVILGDITNLFLRGEDFVIWKPTPTRQRRALYCGSLFMMDAGARPQVHEKFDPETFKPNSRNRYPGGTDQIHMSRTLCGNEAYWGWEHGIYNFGSDIWKVKRRLPENARIVFFNGQFSPDDRDLQNRYSWIKENYKTKTKQIEPAETGAINIITFHWGDWPGDKKLAGLYLQRLVDSVARHMPKGQDYKFIIFSDRHDLRVNGAEVRPLGVDSSLLWNLKKLYMFSAGSNLDRPTICFDLDCVITGSLSPLISALHDNPYRMITCEAAYRPGVAGGSIIGFTPSSKLEGMLWQPIIENRPEIECQTKGSERMFYRRYLSPSELAFWDRLVPGKVASYKRDCSNGSGLPSGTAVVRFHGKPRPHEVVIPWVSEHWKGERDASVKE